MRMTGHTIIMRQTVHVVPIVNTEHAEDEYFWFIQRLVWFGLVKSIIVLFRQLRPCSTR